MESLSIASDYVKATVRMPGCGSSALVAGVSGVHSGLLHCACSAEQIAVHVSLDLCRLPLLAIVFVRQIEAQPVSGQGQDMELTCFCYFSQ